MSLAAVVLCLSTAAAQRIPAELWGKWRIIRQVPTSTISCWGDAEAKTLIGTELEYGVDLFRWKGMITKDPRAEVKWVAATQFHDENSGQGTNSSQVSFRQLGITAKKAKQITIDDPPANLTGATTEIPGDKVIIKDRNRIVFSVCNVYFEAKRTAVLPAQGRR